MTSYTVHVLKSPLARNLVEASPIQHKQSQKLGKGLHSHSVATFPHLAPLSPLDQWVHFRVVFKVVGRDLFQVFVAEVDDDGINWATIFS